MARRTESLPHAPVASRVARDAALVVVHGGAGTWAAPRLAAAMAGLSAAAEVGWAGLAEQGPLFGAVSAVRILEDDATFNAGHGAVPTAEGDIELDASVMDGATRRVGAVAAVRGVPNPVEAAKAVLDDGRHCLLSGRGAVELARGHGVRVDAQLSLRRAAQPQPPDGAAGALAGPGGDTVGAICRDAHARLAVAVSTGGVAGKAPGRIGDTAVCGGGFYADDACGAACCTGLGEAFIRLVLAKRAVDLLAAGVHAPGAARQCVAELTAAGFGVGGLLVVGQDGPPGLASNARHLPWVSRTVAGARTGTDAPS